MSSNFEILEHKGDLKIKVFGKTPQALFQNAMQAMFAMAGYKAFSDTEQNTVRQSLKVRSGDFSSLLVDFLSEVLYWSEVKKIVFEKAQFKKFSENEIEAVLQGRPLQKIGVCIKGVTYHDLSIQQNKNIEDKNKQWQAIILFDI